MDFTGQIKNLDTLRFELRLSEQVHDPDTWPFHICTNICEIDVNLKGCQEQLLADLTGDCYVNIEDFAILAAQWLSCTGAEGIFP